LILLQPPPQREESKNARYMQKDAFDNFTNKYSPSFSEKINKTN